MNRLKFLGKNQRRAATEVDLTPSTTGQPAGGETGKAEAEVEVRVHV